MTDQEKRMAPVMRFVLVASLALIVVLWVISQPLQAPSDVQFFRETGHNVRGEFLAFYNDNGGLEIFGYPITEQFPVDGKIVQYFQNVSMELGGGNSQTSRVRLSSLSETLLKTEPPIDPAPTDAATLQRYFPETGHIADSRFFDFFNTNGGVSLFGYPIAEAADESGQIVQYFQNVRMVWNPVAQQVHLSSLGEVEFDIGPHDPSLLGGGRALGLNPEEPTSEVASIRVDVSVSEAHASFPGTQTVTVFVTDANKSGENRGVHDVKVNLFVEYPGNPTSQRLDLANTDPRGYTALTFDVLPSPLGEKVVIRVVVDDGDFEHKAQASFEPWQ